MPKDVTKKEKKEKKHFFKDFKAELKRVIWPTPKQLVNNTVAVITIVLITAVIVFALDAVFETLNDYGVNKLKTIVETYNEENEATDIDDETTVDDSSDETEDTSDETEDSYESADEASTDNTESETEDTDNTENE